MEGNLSWFPEILGTVLLVFKTRYSVIYVALRCCVLVFTNCQREVSDANLLQVAWMMHQINELTWVGCVGERSHSFSVSLHDGCELRIANPPAARTDSISNKTVSPSHDEYISNHLARHTSKLPFSLCKRYNPPPSRALTPKASSIFAERVLLLPCHDSWTRSC